MWCNLCYILPSPFLVVAVVVVPGGNKAGDTIFVDACRAIESWRVDIVI